MVDEKNIVKVRQFLSKLGLRVSAAYLFGSRAKGNALKSSDFDVIIVSNDFTRMPWFERIAFACGKWKFKESLGPLCYTELEFTKKLGQINVVSEAVSYAVKIV